MNKNALLSALADYVGYGAFVLLGYLLYFHTAYFQALLQPEAKKIILLLIQGYILFGFFYFFIRNSLFPRYLKEESKAILVFRFFFNLPKRIRPIAFAIPKDTKFLDLSIDEKTRVALLSFVVKFFYFPLMLSFFIGHFFSVSNSLQNRPQELFTASSFFNWGFFFLFNLMFLVDTLIFTVGYLLEARWLKNGIKSVDPYLSGWVVALLSYPPFNGAFEQLFRVNAEGLNFFFNQYSVMFALRVLILLLYGIYVWATIALFTKASNLTNRGIVGHGPYRFIRHPAYAAKNIAWWLETLPYFTSFTQIIPLLIWNTLYVLRALTEERHLLKDPDYKEYVKKVKWRFIPKIF